MQRKKNIFIVVFIILAALLMAAFDLNKKVSYEQIEEDNMDISIASLYIALIENIMELDIALNYEMKYLALDTDSFIKENNEKITDLEIQEIIDALYAKYPNVIKGSLEDLTEMGLYHKEKMGIDGILISVLKWIDDKPSYIKENEAFITLMKYRSGTGAVMPTYEGVIEGNEWQLKMLYAGVS